MDKRKQQEEIDAILYERLAKLEEKSIEELEQEVDYEYEFSEEFEKKMEKLIRKQRYSVPLTYLKRVGYGAAVLLLVYGVLWGGRTESVQASWSKIYESIKIMLENKYIHSYESEKEVKKLAQYMPNYIPKGYELVQEIITENISIFRYENKNGNFIVFQQLLAMTQEDMALDLEYISYEESYINGIKLTMYSYEDGQMTSYYEYYDRIFILHTKHLSKKEIVKVYKKWIYS